MKAEIKPRLFEYIYRASCQNHTPLRLISFDPISSHSIPGIHSVLIILLLLVFALTESPSASCSYGKGLPAKASLTAAPLPPPTPSAPPANRLSVQLPRRPSAPCWPSPFCAFFNKKILFFCKGFFNDMPDAVTETTPCIQAQNALMAGDFQNETQAFIRSACSECKRRKQKVRGFTVLSCFIILLVNTSSYFRSSVLIDSSSFAF